MSHEATIRNLDQEQSRLKDKLGRLEEEREALLNQSQASNDQHRQQVLKLEQVPLSQTFNPSRDRGADQLTHPFNLCPPPLPPPLSLCVRSTRVTRRSSAG